MIGLTDTLPAQRLGLAAIERLTDATGMMQHSILSVPDPAHGYCVDDNARALILMHRRNDLPAALREAWTGTFSAFVDRAWNPDRGRFRNFMDRDGAWLEEAGSEDSNGRALWSLGVTAAEAQAPALQSRALALFEQAAGPLSALRSPRAMAFCILAATAVLRRRQGHAKAMAMTEVFAARLARLAAVESRPGWIWFEPVLAYDNCRLPEALLRAGPAMGREDFTRLGIETLGWIETLQRTPAGHYAWVGSQGFGLRHGRPAQYDQQPLEAQGMIEACDAAFQVSRDPIWLRRAERAFAWFHGANDKGATLADPDSGECYDGLTPTGPNLNRGAESVLAYQLGAAAIERLRGHASGA